MNNFQYYFLEYYYMSIETIEKLNTIVKEIGEKLEGNCLYKHHSDFEKRKESEDIINDLKKLSRISTKYFEIGVNAGHNIYEFYSEKLNKDIYIILIKN